MGRNVAEITVKIAIYIGEGNGVGIYICIDEISVLYGVGKAPGQGIIDIVSVASAVFNAPKSCKGKAVIGLLERLACRRFSGEIFFVSCKKGVVYREGMVAV